MAVVATMNFREARACVIDKVTSARRPESEEVPLTEAAWRVLAEDVKADRDYPPLSRSLRDGFAVRSAELPGSFRVIGEVRAGAVFKGEVGDGETVEIMTGAPVPPGAGQVVMVEYTERDDNRMRTGCPAKPGEWINLKGAEAKRGEVIVGAGRRIDHSTVALLAMVGMTRVKVYKKLKVAIIATGDEIVPVREKPLDYQIRNSNAHSLAVQVARAGGEPEVLPVAADEYDATRSLIERGLKADLLLLSGGVSMGKYDIVKEVLSGLGAEFYFEGVLMRPGWRTVFGRVHGKFFFGLPGNPVTTMVTFRVFAQAGLELLSGRSEARLPLFPARLTTGYRHKPGATNFLPAWLSADGAELTPIPWQGSSDVAAVARGNVFVVAGAERESWEAGDWIPVLLK